MQYINKPYNKVHFTSQNNKLQSPKTQILRSAFLLDEKRKMKYIAPVLSKKDFYSDVSTFVTNDILILPIQPTQLSAKINFKK